MQPVCKESDRRELNPHPLLIGPAGETPLRPIGRPFKIGERQSVRTPFGPSVGMVKRFSKPACGPKGAPQTYRSHPKPKEPPAEIAALQNVSELMSQQRDVIDQRRTAQNSYARQCKGTASFSKRIKRNRIYPYSFEKLH